MPPLAVLVLGGALALGACRPVDPPQASPPVSSPDSGASEPVLADIQTLADDAFEGRRAGTPGGSRAADYVERRFRQVGLRGAFDGRFRQPVALPEGGHGVNLAAVVEGTVFPQHALLVTAHYDHLGVRAGQVYNGADDNASGVAALLAVGQALRDDPPAHTVILAAVDAEEQGLVGARAFADAPPVPLGAILAVVNLDMVSRGPLWAAGAAHYPHLGRLLQAARLDVRYGHDTGDGADNWTGASDHAVFHQRGVPFVYLGVEDHADYHQASDDADRIDPTVLGRAVRTITEAVRVLDGAHAALVAGR